MTDRQTDNTQNGKQRDNTQADRHIDSTQADKQTTLPTMQNQYRNSETERKIKSTSEY